jgi:LacI family transcriptional regulator
MPTLHDVARRAGVSLMTVSRVVNGSGGVSPERRRRVEQALAETGYMPNRLARSLRARRSDTIALLLPDMTNPFFTTLAHGVEAAAREAGLTMILANSGEREDEEERLTEMLLQHQVDGILVVPTGSGAETIRLCREHEVPFVAVDRRPAGGNADVVRTDTEDGAHALGELLAGLGHHTMAVLTGPAGLSAATERVAGFRRAVVHDAGLPEPAVYRGAFTIESGREMARRAMASDPVPTALFAANNFIAIGTQHALVELGLRVPEDVALVAFDDLPEAMVTFPFLTVIAQPAYDIGTKSVAVLLDRIAHPDRPAREVVLPNRLVIRRSSGGSVSQLAHPRED